MKYTTFLFLFSVLGLLTLSSCNDDDEPTMDPGTVSIDIDHVWGQSMSPFALNMALTHPRTGDSMTFETFRYYISNIELRNTAGEWVTVPDSYYLVDEAVSIAPNIENVPGGKYTDLRFLFGVDSTANVSGAQAGVLAPSEGMFWSWNTGYIMLKAEGTSTRAEDGTFAFHLGGFAGEYAVPQMAEYTFGGELTVDGDRVAEIHLVGNAARLWHSAPSLTERSKMHMPGEVAGQMTSDFYDGFFFDHIHN